MVLHHVRVKISSTLLYCLFDLKIEKALQSSFYNGEKMSRLIWTLTLEGGSRRQEDRV